MIYHIIDVECCERTAAWICPILNGQCGLEITYAFRRDGPHHPVWAVYASDGSVSASHIAFLRILAEAVSRVSINGSKLEDLRRHYLSTEKCDVLDEFVEEDRSAQ